ncbi:kielin/chordin-like protein [Athalia rosae]|uniref:kielin/chordin-like protein n=1 Tax=Athalia rosae TaxID=37344 RepID=UPI0020343D19|nr:kielin/chordin-like protein [Athalia rosae]
MIVEKYINTMIHLFYMMSILLCTISADQDKVCDKSKCRGVGKYLTDLKCVPTYGPDDDCCPIKYNCDHLKGRAIDKCYFKGHVYEIGETLKPGDGKPCDIGCHCNAGWNGTSAHFSCAIVDCFNRPEPGCYLEENHDQCCPGPKVCPATRENLVKCEVDGKTYLQGQRFTPASDPTKSCICSEGYKGVNVAPFCRDPEPFNCDTELHQATDIYENCVPTFYNSQNPATDCNYASRCQNEKDRVIPGNQTGTPAESDPSDTCTFGRLKMNIGDQLNQGTWWSSVCVRCICEIPPLPTCQHLPDDECDITVHDEFQ